MLKIGEVIKINAYPGKYLVVGVDELNNNQGNVALVNVSDLINKRNVEVLDWKINNIKAITHLGYNKEAMEKYKVLFGNEQ